MQYTDCNLCGAVAFIPEAETPLVTWSEPVFSCDYNGWADVPEEEREAIEAFESVSQVAATPRPPSPVRVPALPVLRPLQKKAA
jgi:hypothetical protein